MRRAGTPPGGVLTGGQRAAGHIVSRGEARWPYLAIVATCRVGACGGGACRAGKLVEFRGAGCRALQPARVGADPALAQRPFSRSRACQPDPSRSRADRRAHCRTVVPVRRVGALLIAQGGGRGRGAPAQAIVGAGPCFHPLDLRADMVAAFGPHACHLQPPACARAPRRASGRALCQKATCAWLIAAVPSRPASSAGPATPLRRGAGKHTDFQKPVARMGSRDGFMVRMRSECAYANRVTGVTDCFPVSGQFGWLDGQGATVRSGSGRWHRRSRR